MKKIKQLIYYGPNTDLNYPVITGRNNPWTSNLFTQHKQISHLGIQGEPGVKFCLNGSENFDAITIGATGVYELDLGEIGYITELRFLDTSLNYYYPTIDYGKRLIVDFVYEGVS